MMGNNVNNIENNIIRHRVNFATSFKSARIQRAVNNTLCALCVSATLR